MRTFLMQLPRCLAGLGFVLALHACGEAVSPTEQGKNASTVNLPVITAQIGDTWDEVVKNSTFKLGPLPMEAGTVINEPHTFVYRGSLHLMRLENVSYMGVSMDGFAEKHPIASIAIGPYRESAATEETWRRLQEIIQRMAQAGWVLDKERNKQNPVSGSAAELRSKYAPLPGGAEGVQKFWYDNDGNEAWVRLVKTLTGHEKMTGEEPRFNLVLDIQVASWPSKHAKGVNNKAPK